MTDFLSLITAAVAKFNEAFEVKTDLKLQASLIKEETLELVEAAEDLMDDLNPDTMECFLKEAADNLYVLAGLILMSQNADKDALEALQQDTELAIAVLHGKAILDGAFRDFLTDEIMLEATLRVHESNMSKLGENGYPVRREDGKVLKGPNYQPADLSDLAEECFVRVSLTSLLRATQQAT